MSIRVLSRLFLASCLFMSYSAGVMSHPFVRNDATSNRYGENVGNESLENLIAPFRFHSRANMFRFSSTQLSNASNSMNRSQHRIIPSLIQSMREAKTKYINRKEGEIKAVKEVKKSSHATETQKQQRVATKPSKHKSKNTTSLSPLNDVSLRTQKGHKSKGSGKGSRQETRQEARQEARQAARQATYKEAHETEPPAVAAVAAVPSTTTASTHVTGEPEPIRPNDTIEIVASVDLIKASCDYTRYLMGKPDSPPKSVLKTLYTKVYTSKDVTHVSSLAFNPLLTEILIQIYNEKQLEKMSSTLRFQLGICMFESSIHVLYSSNGVLIPSTFTSMFANDCELLTYTMLYIVKKNGKLIARDKITRVNQIQATRENKQWYSKEDDESTNPNPEKDTDDPEEDGGSVDDGGDGDEDNGDVNQDDEENDTIQNNHANTSGNAHEEGDDQENVDSREDGAVQGDGDQEYTESSDDVNAAVADGVYDGDQEDTTGSTTNVDDSDKLSEVDESDIEEEKPSKRKQAAGKPEGNEAPQRVKKTGLLDKLSSYFKTSSTKKTPKEGKPKKKRASVWAMRQRLDQQSK